MYTMILVDDHNYLIEGIKKLINWEKLKINIVDVAYDGEEGFKKIKANPPDIVITDVSMPILDGIDMIKALKKEGVKTKFIILTAYSEFKYAKEAMTYGVLDYIVKPILPKDIIDTVMRAVSICDEERNQEINEFKMKQKIVQSRPMLMERFADELFEGIMVNNDDIKNKADMLEISLNAKNYRVISIQIDNYCSFIKRFNESDRDFLRYSLSTIFCGCLNIKNYLMSFKEKSIHYLLLDCEYNSYDLEKQLIDKLEIIIHKCEKVYGIGISIGIGEPVETPVNIKNSFKQSIESLKFRTNSTYGQIIFYRYIMDIRNNINSESIYDKQALIQGLKLSSLQTIQEVVEEMFCNLRNKDYVGMDYVKTQVNYIINTATNFFHERGQDIADELFETGAIIDSIEEYQNFDEIENWLKDFFSALLKDNIEGQSTKNVVVVTKMLKYIRENYNKSISLNDLSKKLYFTPNYLGKIFLKQIKKSFNDYLIEYRIDKAKELLNLCRYKIYEVGEMVGYKDIDYFRRIFKECTSISPTEYINKYCNNIE